MCRSPTLLEVESPCLYRFERMVLPLNVQNYIDHLEKAIDELTDGDHNVFRRDKD